jgi:hypothetical protein
MKRFIVITILVGVSLLAAWVIFEGFAVAAPETKNSIMPVKAQGQADEVLKPDQSGAAAPVAGANKKIAPVFDSTGAIVSDSTGTILSANQSGNLAAPVAGANLMIAPVFDTSGRIVSDPTGTILGANQSGNPAAPVAVADRKIAPVFDNTGRIVSDPTGTILAAPNP